MKKKDLVAEHIKSLIYKGKLRQGDKIPSETEIMKTLNVSRFTAREGINTLKRENIIETLHGSGSFVKNNSLNKKYILIVSEEYCLTGTARGSNRFIINELKNRISELGYIPYFYIDREKSDVLKEIPIIISETIGIVSVHGSERTLDKLSEFHIPIVSVMKSTAREYSTILTNYPLLYRKIDSIIKKYKLEKIVSFSIVQSLQRKEMDTFIHYAFNAYLKKFDSVNINFSENIPSAISLFKAKIKSLKYTPDAIIFQDDTIFNNVFPIFGEFDNILKNTKIITHSSGYRQDWGSSYKICRLEFDLKDMAEKSIELLLKKINGEFINKQNIYIDPTVINEEIFKLQN